MTSSQITFQLSANSEKIISNILKDEQDMSEQELFHDIMVIFCATWQLPLVAQAKIILRKKKKEKEFNFTWKDTQKLTNNKRSLIGKEAVFLVQNILRHEKLEESPSKLFDSAVKNYEYLRKKVNEKSYIALIIYPDGEEEIIAAP